MSPADVSALDAGRRARLAAHVDACEDCRTQPPALDRIAVRLDRDAVDVDAAALSRLVALRLHPALQRRAWQRAFLRLLLALIPLPAVLAYDIYVLGVAYDVVRSLLPTAVAAYLVLSYGALLLLLFALTYAAVPLLVARDRALRAPLAI